MTIPASQAEVAAFLQTQSGRPPLETHISAVFLGAETVWKLRKSVRLPFLDYTDVAERRRMAERELALNAPYAPGLYRGVIPVTRDADGLHLGGEGPVLDWVVAMARVPADRFLDTLADHGALTPTLLDQIADSVAAQHASLAPVQRDLPASMRTVIDGNRVAALTAGLDPATVETWHGQATARIARTEAWLTARAGSGFVRRAHGDLHLGNMCLWQGKPVPFDALEFDEDLATIDLGYDLAFLLMDLLLRCGRPAANRVLNRYVARTGDAALLAGLPLYLSSRALIRAHVLARTGQNAARYLQAAMDFLNPAPPRALAVGGLPGTGKSTFARALAPELGPAPGALILRSDEIRKRRSGVAPEHPLPESAYTSQASEAVMQTLLRDHATALAAGHAAIADATFLAEADRTRIAAASTQVPFTGIWLEAPMATLASRIAARTGDASDADLTILARAAAKDPGPITWHRLDATDPQALARFIETVTHP